MLKDKYKENLESNKSKNLAKSKKTPMRLIVVFSKETTEERTQKDDILEMLSKKLPTQNFINSKTIFQK